MPEAFPIESLKYDEAIELAYFGAQVLHPSAMAPCIEGSIPIFVKNVFNPTHPGTVIQGRACSLQKSSEAWQDAARAATATADRPKSALPLKSGESPIRGITSIDNVAILNIEGTGTSAVPDFSSRIFATLSAADVQPVMVTQASSDASMCVAIEEGQANRAITALETAFQFELSRGTVGGINCELGHSVVAIVGEGMAFRPGTGATFTRAMANAGVNIRTIAQGSSERQISICVERADCTKALRAAHAALALSNTQLTIAVIGATGLVGSELLSQMSEAQRIRDEGDKAGKRKVMDDLNIDFKITAVVKSDQMLLSYDGLDVSKKDAELFGESPEEADLDELTKFLMDDFNGNLVVIDCTASTEVASMYSKWLEKGIHVISANKKTGSGPLEAYEAAQANSRGREANAQWYYETTGPGSGMPVISTLKDMLQSGDRVYKVSGIFSGSLSYILNEVQAGKPLSQAVEAAGGLGLLEPDPRDDLFGNDVRRKVVVLARECGMKLNLEDVEVDSLMPDALSSWQPDTAEGAPTMLAQLVAALKPYDEEVAASIVKKISEDGADHGGDKWPVQLSTVDVDEGLAYVRLAAVPKHSRFASCEANENLIEIQSRRYSEHPMVLQGPGAGPEITASGLFADLLHLSRTLVEWNIPKIN